MEAGESFPECACREVLEETGHQLTKDQLTLVGVRVQPWARHVDALYEVAIGASQEVTIQPGGAGIRSAQWFQLTDLPPLRREARFLLEDSF